MTTYYKLDHSEPGYLSQMLPRADGTWVKRADYYADFAAARAEIERLTKERDEARAQVAVAYKIAAEYVSALEAYGREKVREGMQRAADLFPWGSRDGEAISSTILTEMEKLR